MKSNSSKSNSSLRGFTLIELIVVIAIIAFVAVVGIRSYGNLRATQAVKMNAANIKRVEHALNTYAAMHAENGTAGYFKNFDSLIDAATDGAWYGTPGSIDWAGGDARQVSNGLGIYDGSWKVLKPVLNAAGQGSGATPTLAETQEKNCGMRNTGLYKSLGIYYLAEKDVQLLKDAGITQVLLHNPSTAQATGASRGGYCGAFDASGKHTAPEGLETVGGGGPGFRPDMSAFYPVLVTNGLPVAILTPTSAAYADFGYNQSFDTSSPSDDEKTSAVSSVKLLAFGIGPNAECVKNTIGIGDAPVNPAFDKKNYRQYIAVFALKAGGQGVAGSCRLAGVLDCAGNSYRAATYNVNWTNDLN